MSDPVFEIEKELMRLTSTRDGNDALAQAEDLISTGSAVGETYIRWARKMIQQYKDAFISERHRRQVAESELG